MSPYPYQPSAILGALTSPAEGTSPRPSTVANPRSAFASPLIRRRRPMTLSLHVSTANVPARSTSKLWSAIARCSPISLRSMPSGSRAINSQSLRELWVSRRIRPRLSSVTAWFPPCKTIIVPSAWRQRLTRRDRFWDSTDPKKRSLRRSASAAIALAARTGTVAVLTTAHAPITAAPIASPPAINV